MTDRLRYTPEQIRAESQWKPTPPVYCAGCGERKKGCVCVKPYVHRKRDDELPTTSDWMD